MPTVADRPTIEVREAPATPRAAASAPRACVSESWLMAWTLERAGFPALVSIGREAPSHPGPTPARYAMHLASPISINALVRTLWQLRGRRGPRAIVLVTPQPHASAAPYREHLLLKPDQQVVSIRRNFRKRRQFSARLRLLGVVWKLGDHALPTPRPAAPWRTMRAILAQSPRRVQRQSIPAAELAGFSTDFRATLLSHFAPAALRRLAADLHFEPLDSTRPFCFADPSAAVDPHATLRGPLFIDAGAAITAEHIHAGPGWVTADSPAVTWPGDVQTGRTTEDGRDYFTGPRHGARAGYLAAKRAFDILFALLALAITLPICIAVAIIIKLSDRGPIFFAHTRETVHGHPFRCLKFRTMRPNAEALKAQLRKVNEVDGPQFKMVNDPRVTRIGRFLRKTNIDELPQFINVLVGDMSVVGPRPSPFEENQLCPAWREARLSVRPGITGLWQISRSPNRGAADFQEWIHYDTQYVDRQCFALDMRILLLTIKELIGQAQ